MLTVYESATVFAKERSGADDGVASPYFLLNSNKKNWRMMYKKIKENNWK